MSESRYHVVIVGSGFGGLSAAKALDHNKVDVTVIAKTAHHLFQPLLYQVATGILSEGEIATPTRLLLRKQKNTSVILGDVTDIDLHNRTVTSISSIGTATATPYDGLIVAAGAQQSYFGNDQFAEHAPGLKTIDDALELRARILESFDRAEATHDEIERRRLMTFAVVGAGPTGVEMAGQIAELAHRTLVGAYRNIDTRDARIILIDAAPKVLPPFDDILSAHAARGLTSLGVEILLEAMVCDVDAEGLVIRDARETTFRIEANCKIWSAGVAASPLGARLAEQCGAELDRSGRIHVQDNLSLPGYPAVFVVGDMMNKDSLPALAQVAMQSGKYAAETLLDAVINGEDIRESRQPFRYRDKGSMATISRFNAVAKAGRLRMTGLVGWALWLGVHLAYVAGSKSRLTTFLAWLWHTLGTSRGQLTVTEQQIHARMAIANNREAERQLLTDKESA